MSSTKKTTEPPQTPAPVSWDKFRQVYPDIWQAALELLERHQCVHATRLWEVAPISQFSQYDIGQLANELVTFGPAHWGVYRPTFSQHAFSKGFTSSGFLAPQVNPASWHISVEV